ncbi:MAG TPA: type II secretion system protein [Fimbriimonadaceae bacterium]|jgi:prepilin-type N-terminal cleavage/methylation domain-containing protein
MTVLRPNGRKGFTLVELLVVIGILAVLAAILFPVLATAKRAAKANVALQNLSQIGIATQLYADDNSDYLPYSEGNNCLHLAIIKGFGCNGYSVSLIESLPPYNAEILPYGAKQALFESPVDSVGILAEEPGHQATWYLETATTQYPGSSYEYVSKLGLEVTSLSAIAKPLETPIAYSFYVLGPQTPQGFNDVLFSDGHSEAITHETLTRELESLEQ